MARLFIREDSGRSAVCVQLGVIDLTEGSGATSIASSAALYLAELGYRVRFTECGRPGRLRPVLYEMAGFTERFYGRQFLDVYRVIREDGALRRGMNEECGVEWLVMGPEERDCSDPLTDEMRGRLVRHGGRCEIAVFDIDVGIPGWEFMVADLDVILAVVDPRPSAMEAGVVVFRWLKAIECEERTRVHWIVNRLPEGSGLWNVKRCLKSRNVHSITDFGRDVVMENEYRCRFLWEDKRVREGMEPVFETIFSLEGWA